jgi:hypothetical protein
MAKERKRGPGQPAHIPTDKSRQLVQVLKANGNTLKVISMVIGISDETLMKHYRKELDSGFAQVKSMMGAAVVKSGLAGNIGAQRYWLACFGGPEWRAPRDTDDATLQAGGNTTIIIKGGLASVQQQEPAQSNGHDTSDGTATTDDAHDKRRTAGGDGLT